MSFIELKNVNKTFYPNTNREHYALKNVNLVINKGDFITIIGGNGAGKSTLFNAISGVFNLDSGIISINEKDISSTKEFERAKYISRVFQNPLDNTAPRMTVAENMALALNRGEKRTLKFSRRTGIRFCLKPAITPELFMATASSSRIFRSSAFLVSSP